MPRQQYESARSGAAGKKENIIAETKSDGPALLRMHSARAKVVRMLPERLLSQRRLVAFRHAYDAVEAALGAYESLRDDIYADVNRGISIEPGLLTVHIRGRGIVVKERPA